jgi:hypothetical protein
MKTVASFLTLCFLLMPLTSKAQAPVRHHSASRPTGKILAIGRFNRRPTPEELKIFSLRWYVTGKIDQWFSPKDGNGVVLVLNLSSNEEARSMLEAGTGEQPELLTFELIPVEPLTPLTRLLPQAARPER